MWSFAYRRQLAIWSSSSTCGRSFSGNATPFRCIRMTGDTAPNCTQRVNSSSLSARSPIAKKPPMSEPHVLIPDIPIESPALTWEASPSKSQPTVGSPLQTTWAQRPRR